MSIIDTQVLDLTLKVRCLVLLSKVWIVILLRKVSSQPSQECFELLILVADVLFASPHSSACCWLPTCTMEAMGWKLPPLGMWRGGLCGLNSPEIWRWAEKSICWLDQGQLGTILFPARNWVPTQLSLQVTAAQLHLSTFRKQKTIFNALSAPGLYMKWYYKSFCDTVGITFCCIFLLNFWKRFLDFSDSFWMSFCKIIPGQKAATVNTGWWDWCS